ncbi:MAG: hypothetical protein OER85_11890 [Gammaproteobacteria bacterium]|nr:hypothetical protein [Gammaproteobacteria bacterium]
MNDILQRDHRTVRGTIRYTSKKPDRMDQERGREYFTINVHSDGKRTCIAHCEIDDRPSVMRDITYSLDEDWYPMDCFVRIAVNDRFMGSGWFRFGPDYAECETYTALDGRVTQRMQTNGRLMTFQNHAIVCDSWHMRLFDLSKAGKGVQSIDEMLLSSPDHRGATGPMLFRIGFGVEYVGEENIDVEAGNFDALHFRFVSSPGLPEAHPPYDIWCTNDGDFIFLRGDIGGYMQTFYELVELIQD